MSESILRNLKAFGLTPWQLILGAAVAYGWFTSLMPMPAEMRALNATVQSLGTTIDLTNGRIGSVATTTTNWFSVAGQTMSEFIVFGNDPTGLAGWPDFMAAQKTHFGI